MRSRGGNATASIQAGLARRRKGVLEPAVRLARQDRVRVVAIAKRIVWRRRTVVLVRVEGRVAAAWCG